MNTTQHPESNSTQLLEISVSEIDPTTLDTVQDHLYYSDRQGGLVLEAERRLPVGGKHPMAIRGKHTLARAMRDGKIPEADDGRHIARLPLRVRGGTLEFEWLVRGSEMKAWIADYYPPRIPQFGMPSVS